MKRSLPLVIAVGFLSGCAALFNPASVGVLFTSEPNGAEVLINGHPFGHTPLSLNIKQKGDYDVTFRKAGYEDHAYRINDHVGAGWIVLDVLGGLFPIVIDAATGSWYSLDDKSVHGVLPEAKIPTGTDSVTVNATTAPNPAIVPANAPPVTESVKHVDPSAGVTDLARLPGVPVTIALKNGDVLPAVSIDPHGLGTYEVKLMNGKTRYLEAGEIKTVITEDGTDWTKAVLEDRKSVRKKTENPNR